MLAFASHRRRGRCVLRRHAAGRGPCARRFAGRRDGRDLPGSDTRFGGPRRSARVGRYGALCFEHRWCVRRRCGCRVSPDSAARTLQDILGCRCAEPSCRRNRVAAGGDTRRDQNRRGSDEPAATSAPGGQDSTRSYRAGRHDVGFGVTSDRARSDHCHGRADRDRIRRACAGGRLDARSRADDRSDDLRLQHHAHAVHPWPRSRFVAGLADRGSCAAAVPRAGGDDHDCGRGRDCRGASRARRPTPGSRAGPGSRRGVRYGPAGGDLDVCVAAPAARGSVRRRVPLCAAPRGGRCRDRAAQGSAPLRCQYSRRHCGLAGDRVSADTASRTSAHD